MDRGEALNTEYTRKIHRERKGVKEKERERDRERERSGDNNSGEERCAHISDFCKLHGLLASKSLVFSSSCAHIIIIIIIILSFSLSLFLSRARAYVQSLAAHARCVTKKKEYQSLSARGLVCKITIQKFRIDSLRIIPVISIVAEFLSARRINASET